MAELHAFDSCGDPFLNGPVINSACGQLVSQCTLFLALINSIVEKNEKISRTADRTIPAEEARPSYDFVVIGSGSGGATVAGRLSEVSGYRVLLLEAGPDEPYSTQIPSNFNTFAHTNFDWNYKTRGENTSCLRNNGVCSWPRGKNLGGTTSHHGMAYHRGNPKDYERWEKMGNEGWSWEEVKPYFLKSEDNREISRVGSKYHATGGPLPVERFPWQPQFAWDILKAGEELGYGVTEDMVGDKITGFTVAQTISDNGVRVSSSASYLWPNKDRTNLDVIVNAYATKIVFKEKKAVAVEYIKDGSLQSVSVTREVIVSGGAVNSPQLLLLSGIGPKKQLTELKIPVVHNLPGVGENLHNHVSYGLNFTINDSEYEDKSTYPLHEYLYNQTGPMSATGLAQVTAILASNYTTPDDPDVQLFFGGYVASCENRDNTEVKQIAIQPVNLHPRSRGRLTLASSNPLDYPLITSNDLLDPQDVKVLLWAIRAALSMLEAPTMRKLNLTLSHKPMPECEAYEYMSDEYWTCAMRLDTRTENHQTGSCKMGTDKMAVVDPQLRVHGVQGVRVVDSSSLPLVVSGNPAASIHMVAERAADFIKADHPCENVS